jgi:hypothetical protein
MAPRRKSTQTRVPWAIGGVVLVVALAGAGGLYWKAGVDKAAATVRAQQQWAGIRQTIVTRLHQSNPIELGAVWAMHTGRICGLVNGKSSFGGLTGMTPFFTQGAQVFFSFDLGSAKFDQPWLECSGDSWIPLVAGTHTEGYCGTRAGAAHCYMTDHAPPGELR